MSHPTFLELRVLTLLRSCAKRLKEHFKLPRYRLDLFDFDDPERTTCRGICYPDGQIHVNFRKRRGCKYDRLESAIDTVIHELTHLKYSDHNKEFWAFHQKMKRWFFKHCY